MATTDLYQDPNQQKKKPQQGGQPGDLAATAGGPIGDPRSMMGGGPAPAQTPDAPLATTNRPDTAPAPAQTPTAPLATTNRPQTPPAPAQTPTADPFAASGGGTYISGTGQWIPNNNPAAIAAAQGQAGQTGQTPPATAPAGTPTDPFAASGGGTYIAATGQWVPNNNPAGIAAAQAAAGQPAAPTAPGDRGTGGPAPPAPQTPPTTAPPTAPPTTTGGNAASDQQSAYRDALMKMLGDAGTPASINDPSLKAQSDAFNLGQTRSLDAARSAMAERAAAEGGTGTSSGAFDQGLMGLYQQQGEAQAGNNAGLVGQANQQKLAQMQSALQMMGNDVNSEQGRQLQKQIADTQAQIQRDQLTQQGSQFGQSLAAQQQNAAVDAELKRLGINSQTSLGQGDLSLRDKLGSGQLNLGLLQALMQNSQFGQNLGANLGMFNSGQNQQALLQMLGQLGGG